MNNNGAGSDAAAAAAGSCYASDGSEASRDALDAAGGVYRDANGRALSDLEVRYARADYAAHRATAGRSKYATTQAFIDGTRWGLDAVDGDGDLNANNDTGVGAAIDVGAPSVAVAGRAVVGRHTNMLHDALWSSDEDNDADDATPPDVRVCGAVATATAVAPLTLAASTTADSVGKKYDTDESRAAKEAKEEARKQRKQLEEQRRQTAEQRRQHDKLAKQATKLEKERREAELAKKRAEDAAKKLKPAAAAAPEKMAVGIRVIGAVDSDGDSGSSSSSGSDSSSSDSDGGDGGSSSDEDGVCATGGNVETLAQLLARKAAETRCPGVDGDRDSLCTTYALFVAERTLLEGPLASMAAGADGEYTLLAPTDAAWAAVDQQWLATMRDGANRKALRRVLLRHVVRGRWTTGAMRNMIGRAADKGGVMTTLARDRSAIVSDGGRRQTRQQLLVAREDDSSRIIVDDTPATGRIALRHSWSASNGEMHSIDGVIGVARARPMPPQPLSTCDSSINNGGGDGASVGAARPPPLPSGGFYFWHSPETLSELRDNAAQQQQRLVRALKDRVAVLVTRHRAAGDLVPRRTRTMNPQGAAAPPVGALPHLDKYSDAVLIDGSTSGGDALEIKLIEAREDALSAKNAAAVQLDALALDDRLALRHEIAAGGYVVRVTTKSNKLDPLTLQGLVFTEEDEIDGVAYIVAQLVDRHRLASLTLADDPKTRALHALGPPVVLDIARMRNFIDRKIRTAVIGESGDVSNIEGYGRMIVNWPNKISNPSEGTISIVNVAGGREPYLAVPQYGNQVAVMLRSAATYDAGTPAAFNHTSRPLARVRWQCLPLHTLVERLDAAPVAKYNADRELGDARAILSALGRKSLRLWCRFRKNPTDVAPDELSEDVAKRVFGAETTETHLKYEADGDFEVEQSWGGIADFALRNSTPAVGVTFRVPRDFSDPAIDNGPAHFPLLPEALGAAEAGSRADADATKFFVEKHILPRNQKIDSNMPTLYQQLMYRKRSTLFEVREQRGANQWAKLSTEHKNGQSTVSAAMRNTVLGYFYDESDRAPQTDYFAAFVGGEQVDFDVDVDRSAIDRQNDEARPPVLKLLVKPHWSYVMHSLLVLLEQRRLQSESELTAHANSRVVQQFRRIVADAAATAAAAAAADAGVADTAAAAAGSRKKRSRKDGGSSSSSSSSAAAAAAAAAESSDDDDGGGGAAMAADAHLDYDQHLSLVAPVDPRTGEPTAMPELYHDERDVAAEARDSDGSVEFRAIQFSPSDVYRESSTNGDDDNNGVTVADVDVHAPGAIHTVRLVGEAVDVDPASRSGALRRTPTGARITLVVPVARLAQIAAERLADAAPTRIDDGDGDGSRGPVFLVRASEVTLRFDDVTAAGSNNTNKGGGIAAVVTMTAEQVQIVDGDSDDGADSDIAELRQQQPVFAYTVRFENLPADFDAVVDDDGRRIAHRRVLLVAHGADADPALRPPRPGLRPLERGGSGGDTPSSKWKRVPALLRAPAGRRAAARIAALLALGVAELAATVVDAASTGVLSIRVLRAALIIDTAAHMLAAATPPDVRAAARAAARRFIDDAAARLVADAAHSSAHIEKQSSSSKRTQWVVVADADRATATDASGASVAAAPVTAVVVAGSGSGREATSSASSAAKAAAAAFVAAADAAGVRSGTLLVPPGELLQALPAAALPSLVAAHHVPRHAGAIGLATARTFKTAANVEYRFRVGVRSGAANASGASRSRGASPEGTATADAPSHTLENTASGERVAVRGRMARFDGRPYTVLGVDAVLPGVAAAAAARSTNKK